MSLFDINERTIRIGISTFSTSAIQHIDVLESRKHRKRGAILMFLLSAFFFNLSKFAWQRDEPKSNFYIFGSIFVLLFILSLRKLKLSNVKDFHLTLRTSGVDEIVYTSNNVNEVLALRRAIEEAI